MQSKAEQPSNHESIISSVEEFVILSTEQVHGLNHTSMGVSLLSAAATSVSIFKAEPNPIKETNSQKEIHDINQSGKRKGTSHAHICNKIKAHASKGTGNTC